MTVDTGAALTLLSENVISPEIVCNTKKAVGLVGINGEANKLKSLRLVSAKFYIGEHALDHELQVVDKSISFSADRLLGYDFLKKYGANLDLKNNVMELSTYFKGGPQRPPNKINALKENNKETKKEEFKGFTLQDAITNASDNEFSNLFKV